MQLLDWTMYTNLLTVYLRLVIPGPICMPVTASTMCEQALILHLTEIHELGEMLLC